MKTITLGGVELSGALIPTRGLTWGRGAPTEEFARHGRVRDVRSFGGAWYSSAVHTIPVLCREWTGTGTQAASYRAAQALIEAVAVPKALLSVYDDATGTSRSTTVLSVETSEADISEDGDEAIVTMELTCEPYWEIAVARTHTATGTGPVALVTDLPTVGGQAPARTRIRAESNAATDSAALAVFPSPPDSYQPSQDYSGLADADAVGGQVVKETGLTTANTLGVPTVYGNADLGPSVLALARVKGYGSPVTYRARSAVTGSVITTVTEALSDEIVVDSATFETVALGPVPVPAGAVPSVQTGSGFQTAETDSPAYTTPDGSVMLPLQRGVGQSAVFLRCISTGVSLMVDTTAGTSRTLKAFLVNVTSGLPGSIVYASGTRTVAGGLANAVLRWDWDVPIALEPGTYALTVVPWGEGDVPLGGATSISFAATSGYSGGTAFTNAAYTWATSATDLYFAHHCRLAVGFDCEVGVQASGATVDAALDHVTLLPAAFGASVVTAAQTAGEGVLWDFADDDARTWHPYEYSYDFATEVEGYGPTLAASAEAFGPPVRLQPGENAIVAHFGLTDGEATDAAWRVYVEFYERYLYPIGDGS